jgi:L-lactate utilization protein LutB
LSEYRTESWREKQAYAELRAKGVMEALQKRGITAHYAATLADAQSAAAGYLFVGAKVAYGDSASLYESGILALIKQGKYSVCEWDKPGTSGEEMKRIWREGFSADVYFSGVNALTEDGIIVNMDSTGNRTAPIFFGPDKVVLLAGINKLVKGLPEAFARAHEASVINNIKWQCETPCVKTGRCMNCQPPGRICAYTQIIENNIYSGRINVILVGQSLGY